MASKYISNNDSYKIFLLNKGIIVLFCLNKENNSDNKLYLLFISFKGFFRYEIKSGIDSTFFIIGINIFFEVFCV